MFNKTIKRDKLHERWETGSLNKYTALLGNR